MASIKDYVKKGGKLPGQEGFNKEAIQKDVNKRKQERASKAKQQTKKAVVHKSVVTPTLGQNEFIPSTGGTSTAQTPEAQFTQESVDLIKSGKAYVSKETQSIVDRDAFGIVTDKSQETQTEKTNALVIGAGSFGTGAIKTAVPSLEKLVASQTLLKVGTTGVTSTATSTASKIAVNTFTKKATTTWLSKLATATTNPAFIVSTLIGTIGSYPFAGFIKEEALQTSGFAVKTALDNGDVQGAEEALELQKEILDPGMWGQILEKVPYANVLVKLKDFYEAARLKLTIDEKVVSDMKIQQETGETDDVKWARVKQEQSDQEQANIDYYNQERKKLLQWEREAEEQQRNEDAAFWKKQREDQSRQEAADRQAQADFWAAYKKESAKQYADSRPSKLNFGLI